MAEESCSSFEKTINSIDTKVYHEIRRIKIRRDFYELLGDESNCQVS